MRNVLLLLVAVGMLSLTAACADDGLAAGEPDPDQDLDPGDTYTSSDWIQVGAHCVRHGNVAVDYRTGTSWVVQAVRDAPCNGNARRTLFAVQSGKQATRIMDVTRHEDVRITFPEDRVLVMAEYQGLDEIYMMDPDDLRITAKLRSRAQYYTSRTSPSRRYVTVADSLGKTGALHVIDTREFVTTVIPHTGNLIQTQWLNHRDMLVAMVFYGNRRDGHHARILAWSFEDGAERPLFRDVEGGLWVNPEIDVRVEDVVPGDATPRIRVRDDDTWVSFLARDLYGDDLVLTMELDTRAVGVSPDFSGPAVWVADGRLAGWRMAEAGVQVILVDPVSAKEEILGVMPQMGRPNLHAHPNANHLLAFQDDDLESFTVFDVNLRRPSRLFVRHHALGRAASLGEDDVWFIAGDKLNRVDLEQGQLAAVPIGQSVRNLSPAAGGQLVLTSAEDNSLLRLDPETLEVERIELPLAP
jgi:hypothetical protein